MKNLTHNSLLYKAAVSLCVCVRACVRVCVCFRHDRQTETKFGTHIQIDMGLIRTYKNWPHAWPERLGSLGPISEIGLSWSEQGREGGTEEGSRCIWHGVGT